MGWASNYIKQLKDGETISFRPRGNSMEGKISSGQLCTVEPVTDTSELKKGDIVLCYVGGNQYLHLIKSISGNQYKIANNKGRINGTITRKNIFGLCIKVES
ncbi:S24 family peptidase [Vibrio splendidus]|nr:S24/S26 family peptidase [Vibrio splendidus]MCC4882518.1 S24/S26 family peptidase [Vibrio splendidus]